MQVLIVFADTVTGGESLVWMEGTAESQKFLVYPNPAARDKITIETREMSNDAVIILRNEKGVAVYESKLTGHKADISVNRFAAGMYHITLVGEESTVHS